MRKMDIALLSLIGALGFGSWATAVSTKLPAPVVAEYTEADIELYEGLYKATLEPTGLAVVGDWTDADHVVMMAAALQAVWQWDSQQTWRPGFEAWLRTVHELTPEQIVAVVDQANARRAAQVALAALAELDKLE